MKELHFVFQFFVLSLYVIKMSKNRKIEFVLPVRRIEQQSEENSIVIDCSKCCICQKKTKEQLLCSFNTKNQEQSHIQKQLPEVFCVKRCS